jgi:hypothetical protein
MTERAKMEPGTQAFEDLSAKIEKINKEVQVYQKKSFNQTRWKAGNQGG